MVKLCRFSDYPVPVHYKGVRRCIGRKVQAVSEAPMCKNSETGKKYYPFLFITVMTLLEG